MNTRVGVVKHDRRSCGTLESIKLAALIFVYIREREKARSHGGRPSQVAGGGRRQKISM